MVDRPNRGLEKLQSNLSSPRFTGVFRRAQNCDRTGSVRDAKTLDLAARQGGIVLRAQALEVGHTPASIRHRLEFGGWTNPYRGVYRVLPPGDEVQQLTAAIHALPDAVVSHESAARLLGVGNVPATEATVTVHASTTHRFEEVRVRRAVAGVADAHRVSIDGLPTTTVPRTLIDLAADLHPPVWEELAGECVVSGRTSLVEMRRVASAVCKQGKPGSALINDFLADAEASRSRLERKVAVLLAPLGPIAQYPAPWNPDLRLDFAFPEAKVAVEVDGYRFHANRKRFDADRQRDRDALRAGWQIIRVTWTDVRERPEEILATILACIRRAKHGLATP